ncbi:MAG: hypothetical protein ACTSX8_05120 [Alphaproteobacteria bacterium]
MSETALIDSIIRLGLTCNHVEKLGAESAKRWKPTLLERRTGTTRGNYWVCAICGTIEHPANLPSEIG